MDVLRQLRRGGECSLVRKVVRRGAFVAVCLLADDDLADLDASHDRGSRAQGDHSPDAACDQLLAGGYRRWCANAHSPDEGDVTVLEPDNIIHHPADFLSAAEILSQRIKLAWIVA